MGGDRALDDRQKHDSHVGALTPIARIHDPSVPPATYADADIRAWLVSRLDGTHPEWPRPDANTVYALYFPPGVTITTPFAGASCTGFHGYHDNTTLADGTDVVYAVISRCPSIPEDPTIMGIDYVSAVASHEVIEAVTDPLVETKPLGYYETDANHIVWSFLGLAEVGDMCALEGEAFYRPSDFPYEVQRMWSNAAAAAGHEPCLPQPAGEVYFNTTPMLEDKVGFAYHGFLGKTQGVLVPVGQTKTVNLDLWSEGPTASPWNVAVHEVGGSNLDLSLDKSSGTNGDHLALTIHVKAKSTTYGAEPFLVESTLGTQKHLWVGLVGN